MIAELSHFALFVALIASGCQAVLPDLWDGLLGVMQSCDASVFTFTRLLISTRNLRAPLSANTVVWNAGLRYVILG